MAGNFGGKVAKLNPWYQRVEFPDGTVVGTWPTEEKCALLAGEIDLRERTVLDVACMSGMATKWFEEQGATVQGCDIDVNSLLQFALVKKAFGLKADATSISVYDLDPDLGHFDVVLMMGLYYHLQDPLRGLRATWDMTVAGGVLLLEGEISDKDGCFADFYEHEYLGDATNWWVPTKECLLAWCRTLPGVARIETVWPFIVPSRMGVRIWKAAP